MSSAGIPSFPFEIGARDGVARTGVISTPRGPVETPCFMPVGTKGTVKGVSPERLEVLGAQIVLANTYHLALRPGTGTVRALGGLHRFMGWDGPLLTDSGGFQVFSLQDTAKITNEGVTFRSVYDGSLETFTPERAMAEQQALGADFVMCFDECPPGGAPHGVVEAAVERTTAWARRCRRAHENVEGRGTDGPQMLFGIVQGGVYGDLRARSVEELVALDFPGYAIGGLSVGEDRSQMVDVAAETASLLPAERPRYFMGIGDPDGVLDMVSMGVDMFDCVLPTRVARMGTAFTAEGRLNLRNACHAESGEPIERDCACPACRVFSRGVIRHLVMQREMLGLQMLTEHNLWFLFRLVEDARAAIRTGVFDAFRRERRGMW